MLFFLIYTSEGFWFFKFEIWRRHHSRGWKVNFNFCKYFQWTVHVPLMPWKFVVVGRWEHRHLPTTSIPSSLEVAKLAGKFSSVCSVFAERRRHPPRAPWVFHYTSVSLASLKPWILRVMKEFWSEGWGRGDEVKFIRLMGLKQCWIKRTTLLPTMMCQVAFNFTITPGNLPSWLQVEVSRLEAAL